MSRPDLVPVKRALLSVSDKTGLVEFARTLVEEFGVTLLSTGGTARALRDAGLKVTDVSEATGFPEMMDGRVKTLHPNIHGAILGRLPEDEAVMRQHGIEPIDLVCVNLYPFEETVAKKGVTYEEAIENIDIGGPAMVRSAAKNHARVLVVMQDDEYINVLNDMRSNGGATSFKLRKRLAGNAFGYCSNYDSLIAHYVLTKPQRLQEKFTNNSADAMTDPDMDGFMPTFYRRAQLRYGENPHQQATLFCDIKPTEDRVGQLGLTALSRQLHGKQLGYINLLDADAALNVVKEFDVPAACIVKHATPCGVGITSLNASPDRQGGGSGPNTNTEPLPHGRGSRAFERAYAGDPLAAFGGVIAFNRPVDVETARAMVEGQKFLEVIVAQTYDDEALAILKDRWKNVRILEVGPVPKPDGQQRQTIHHYISGGLLIQTCDLVGVVESEWKIVSARQPTDAELAAMKFNWLVCKHVKSNAVVIGGEHGTYGIGGGQVDRVAAALHAVRKAGDRAGGAVAASDAFFPFPDGPRVLLDAGVIAIAQPGGSVRDQETIDLVNECGAAMVFTGRRHFRH